MGRGESKMCVEAEGERVGSTWLSIRWVGYKLMVEVLMLGNGTLNSLSTVKQGYITNCMHVSVID